MSAMVSPASFGGGGGGSPGAFAVPLDYYSVAGGRASAFAGSINTNPVTAMPGGVAPFSYSWAITALDPDWEVLTPGSAATQFRRENVAPGDSQTASFECTVTDATGAVATSDPCQATVTNYGDPGGFLP